MPTTFIRPHKIELCSSEPSNASSCSLLVTLRVRYREDGNWQVYPLVFVSEEARQLFDEGEVTGIHLDTLQTNGVASRALPGVPAFVVLGLETRDGAQRVTTPTELLVIRRRLMIQGSVLMASGLGLLAMTSSIWLGVSALMLGSHVLRTATGVPTRPFWPPQNPLN